MNYLSTIFFALTYSLSLIATEPYRRANNTDVLKILSLINKYAYKDADKIVIVPEIFREKYVTDAIKQNRLFVATCDNKIVGYKKLFCITDDAEASGILCDELRFNAKPTDFVLASLNLKEIHQKPFTKISGTYIYNGADFTHPDYRSRGINRALTEHALDAILNETITHMKSHMSNHVTIIYGLTRDNAGNHVLDGRSKGIAESFISFARKLAYTSKCNLFDIVTFQRYQAYKPSFDADSDECKPLPDEASIPGYGCAITCRLESN